MPWLEARFGDIINRHFLVSGSSFGHERGVCSLGKFNLWLSFAYIVLYNFKAIIPMGNEFLDKGRDSFEIRSNPR